MPPHTADLPTPLISADELARRIEDPNLVVVDTRWYLGRPGRGRETYLEGHIPGAIHLDLDDDLADLKDPHALGAPGRHPLPDPRSFTAHLGELGIGNDSSVVAYDDVGGWVAARLWWMLDNLGFARVAVLDGGIAAWTAAGHALTQEEPSRPPQNLHLADRWSRVIERDDLRSRLGSIILLDARAAPRYRGETEPIDPVAGHIPTAINHGTDANLTRDGRFLEREELRRRFVDLGPVENTEAVTSCGSGTSACHHVLAMRLAGLPDPTLYVGSYSDWSRSGYPVAVGADPGSATIAASAGDGQST